VPRRQVLLVDLQRPWQIGRLPEQFLVEPVAPPPDRLGERERGHAEGDDYGRWDPASFRLPRPDGDAGDQPARDAEPTLPDLRDRAEIGREARPVGVHVVQAGADGPRPHAPDADRAGVVTG